MTRYERGQIDAALAQLAIVSCAGCVDRGRKILQALADADEDAQRRAKRARQVSKPSGLWCATCGYVLRDMRTGEPSSEGVYPACGS